MKSFAVPAIPAVLLVGMLLLPSSVPAHDAKQNAAPTAAPVDAAVQPAVATVDAFSKALQAADFATVEALLASDVLILESGGAERSRQEYLHHHARSDAAFLKAAHVRMLKRTARTEGDLVWVGTESEIHASKDGKPLTLLTAETMVLKRSDDRWRIVHIHWSSRPKPAKSN